MYLKYSTKFKAYNIYTMDAMRNINDPRINLLTAIKPFLSSGRQKKLSNCIRLFQVTQITKLMSDPEKTI